MMKKRVLFLGAATFILTGAVVYLSRDEPPTEPVVASHPQAVVDWNWENPYTYKNAPLPSRWQAGEQIPDTLLTLTHETGKSLVYLIYEATEDTMSLQEYVDVMMPANTDELGTGEFKAVMDKSSQEFYQASGAKYFGNNLVATNVRIWSDQPDHFWRSVSMTNMEYKELEYEAERVVDSLLESTR